MTRLIITGSKGRMGQALLACAARFPDIQITSQIDLGDKLTKEQLAAADVLVDFSSPEATVDLAVQCATRGKAMVIGTTGHQESQRKAIIELQDTIPIVWSANYSTGVNALFWLTRKAAEILGPGFDLEVIEMHHRYKKDAPSGTAMSLAKILAEARGQVLVDSLRHGREGLTGARTATEIGVHSLRGGDVVGDHTVIFAALGERLELTHRATSRETLANGALRAAQWVMLQKPGLYDMQHVLGLK